MLTNFSFRQEKQSIRGWTATPLEEWRQNTRWKEASDSSSDYVTETIFLRDGTLEDYNKGLIARRLELPALHIQCTSRAVSVLRNSRYLKKPSAFACLSKFARKSKVRRGGQAQGRAQSKLERNRRWFERKKSTFLVPSANAPYGELHTRVVQTTSLASTPQDVSGLAVGQGNHARIFVDLRHCGDRSACQVLTPPSALAPTVLTSSKLRFWHALKGQINEEYTFRQGSWTVNCRPTTEKVCFFSPRRTK